MNTHNVDEKRGRRQMLLIYVAIGIIAAVITGWFVYQNRMEYWETQARSAFRVALGKELQKGMKLTCISVRQGILGYRMIPLTLRRSR